MRELVASRPSPESSKQFQIGDVVFWSDCPSSLEIFNPFTVRAVERDMVWVDWIRHPIKQSRLIQKDVTDT